MSLRVAEFLLIRDVACRSRRRSLGAYTNSLTVDAPIRLRRPRGSGLQVPQNCFEPKTLYTRVGEDGIEVQTRILFIGYLSLWACGLRQGGEVHR